MIPGKIDIECAGWKKYLADHAGRTFRLLCFIRVVESIGNGRSVWNMPVYKVFDNYARKALRSKRGKKYLGVTK